MAATWPAIDPETAKLIDDDVLCVVNKADLLREPEPIAIEGRAVLKLSCKTGLGFDGLVARIEDRAHDLMGVGDRRLRDPGAPPRRRWRRRRPPWTGRWKPASRS